MSWPARIRQGWVGKGLHSHYDVFPTLLELAEAENPLADILPGRSFASSLLSGEDTSDDEVVVFDEYGPVRMIRFSRMEVCASLSVRSSRIVQFDRGPQRDAEFLVKEARYGGTCCFRCVAVCVTGSPANVDPARDGIGEGVTGFGRMA